MLWFRKGIAMQSHFVKHQLVWRMCCRKAERATES